MKAEMTLMNRHDLRRLWSVRLLSGRLSLIAVMCFVSSHLAAACADEPGKSQLIAEEVAYFEKKIRPGRSCLGFASGVARGRRQRAGSRAG